jgi:hypothetical protein
MQPHPSLRPPKGLARLSKALSNSVISACDGIIFRFTTTSHGSSGTHPEFETETGYCKFLISWEKLLANNSEPKTNVKSIVRALVRSSPFSCMRRKTSPLPSPGNSIRIWKLTSLINTASSTGNVAYETGRCPRSDCTVHLGWSRTAYWFGFAVLACPEYAHWPHNRFC